MRKINAKALDAEVRRLKNAIDDYKQSVEAIFTLAHVMLWDSGSGDLRSDGAFVPGPRMTTSAANVISPEEEVTPDLAVAVDGGWGLIAEAKKSFCRDSTHWIEDLKQLKKYDDDLSGWPPQLHFAITHHGIALLVHNSRKVVVSDYIAERIDGGDVTYDRQLSVVAFHRVDEATKYLSLERYSGELPDENLDEALRKVIQVPMRHLIDYDLHFYDSEPPIPHTMSVIWNEVLPELASVTQYKTSRQAGQAPVISVSASETTDILKRRRLSGIRAGGADVPEIPRKQWISEALRAMARFGYAQVQDHEHFSVEFKRLASPLDEFIEKRAKELVEQQEEPKPGRDARQETIDFSS